MLTKAIHELGDTQFTKMEETNRIRNAKDKLRDVIVSKTQDIARKRAEIKANSAQIAELDVKVESIKGELEALQVQQIDHYYKVLQFGMDTRQEGLSWVIKALWILGENVKI